MHDPPAAPTVTVVDPSRPAPRAASSPRVERSGPSRIAVPLAVLVAVLALLPVLAVHERAQRERQAAADRGRSALHLTASVDHLDSEGGTPSAPTTWTARLNLTSREPEGFQLLGVALDQAPWATEPADNPMADATSHLVDVHVTGGCAMVERLASPRVLQVSARRPGGRVVSTTVPLRLSEILIGPRQQCGLAGVGESLSADTLAARRQRTSVVLELQLSNGSRDAGSVTAVGIARAHVVIRPTLPLPLAPFREGEPGRTARLALTVRYDRCPGDSPGQELPTTIEIDLLDGHGQRSRVAARDGIIEAYLGQLAHDACRS